MISVIIPVWNHFEELKKCLQTLKEQNYKNFEVIVVDDGSKLNIFDQQFDTQDLNIKFCRLEKNSGGNAARNYGFDQSKGEYLVFVDADLELRQDFLSQLLQKLEENPKVSYAYPSFRYGHKNFALYEFDAKKMKQENYVPIASLIRREHFPRFDESLKRWQDWDLWLTMLEQNHIGIWIPLYLYRANLGGSSGSYFSKSQWLPRIFFKMPFIFDKLLPFLFRKRRQDYYQSRDIVIKKHGLTP